MAQFTVDGFHSIRILRQLRPTENLKNAVGQAFNGRLPGSKAHGDGDTVVLESPPFRTI